MRRGGGGEGECISRILVGERSEEGGGDGECAMNMLFASVEDPVKLETEPDFNRDKRCI